MMSVPAPRSKAMAKAKTAPSPYRNPYSHLGIEARVFRNNQFYGDFQVECSPYLMRRVEAGLDPRWRRGILVPPGEPIEGELVMWNDMDELPPGLNLGVRAATVERAERQRQRRV